MVLVKNSGKRRTTCIPSENVRSLLSNLFTPGGCRIYSSCFPIVFNSESVCFTHLCGFVLIFVFKCHTGRKCICRSSKPSWVCTSSPIWIWFRLWGLWKSLVFLLEMKSASSEQLVLHFKCFFSPLHVCLLAGSFCGAFASQEKHRRLTGWWKRLQLDTATATRGSSSPQVRGDFTQSN